MSGRGTVRGLSLARTAALAALLLPVGACDLWLGAEDPPLEGERISILVHERELLPDPGATPESIILPAPTPNPDWPQAGGYPNHAMHHIQVADAVARAWGVDVGSGADDEERFVSSPVIANGRVYAMDSETQVGAFDAATGEEAWQVELTPDDEDEGHIGGGLAYEAGRLFVTTGFAQVIALDAATGDEIWRRSLSGPMRTAPTVRAGRVFVLAVDNKLTVLAAEDGSTQWTHDGITEVASLLGGASPAVGAGVVVVAYSSGELVALKVETGRVVWTDSLATVRRTDVVSTLQHIRGRPIIDRGRVFAISHGGVMVSIDLRSGRRVWTRDIGGLESPWVAGDYIFAITNNAELVCLSRDDGRIQWVTGLPAFGDEEDREDPIVWTGPILASDRLIVAGNHGEALAVSPYSGQVLGRLDMPDAVTVPPVVADGTIYFLSDDAELTAYR